MGALRMALLVHVRSVRLISWWHLALGLIAAGALAATRRTTYPDDLVFGLRIAGVALAASAAFVFDDPAVSLVDSKPVPLGVQRAARFVLALPAVGAGWWLLVRWMEAGLGPVDDRAMATLPRLAVSLEFLTLLGIVWAVATLVMRTGRDAGGMAAALSLLAIVVALVLLPERWSVFSSPAVPPLPGEAPSVGWNAWVDAHRRWAAIAAAAWAGVVLGLTGSTRRRLLARPIKQGIGSGE